ncbi:MAG: DUF5615 family PIN-like protein [Spirochaetia bacterium]|nr:DUF5615 family PIN-like protein [Spirochaetia bacterium]
MKFKIDENLPTDLKNILKDNSFDAHLVFDENIQGIDDKSLINISKKENRIFLTMDLDFSDIREYPPQDYHGIIVLRPKNQDVETINTLVKKVIPVLRNIDISGKLLIVDQNKIRIKENT